MDVALRLRGRGARLQPDATLLQRIVRICQAANAHVLEALLYCLSQEGDCRPAACSAGAAQESY